MVCRYATFGSMAVLGDGWCTSHECPEAVISQIRSRLVRRSSFSCWDEKPRIVGQVILQIMIFPMLHHHLLVMFMIRRQSLTWQR